MALPDIVQANPFAAINQGVQAKNQLAQQAMQIENQAQQQNDRNAFNKAIGMAATGDRTGGQNYLATSAPGALPDYQGYVSQLDAGKAAQLQQANQQIFRKVQEISQLPPEQRQPAYQAAKAKLAADGGDVSWLPDDVDSGLKAAYTHVASFDQVLKASGLGPQDSIVVAPGSVLANKSTGAPLFTNPVAPKADPIVSVGVPGGTQQFYNTPSGLKPIGSGGGTPQAGGASDPMNALIQQANARVQSGEDPDVVQADLLKQAQGAPGVSVGGAGGLGFTPSKPMAGQQAPSGYRYQADGTTLEPIPGGPADKGNQEASFGDATKTGQDYLASIPDASLRGYIQQIVNGQQPLPKVSRPSKMGEIGPMQIAQAVAQVDPTFDQNDPTARTKARNDFTSGQAAKQLRSLNTLLGHLGGLADAADKLDNSGTPAWNYVANKASAASGNTAVTNFINARDPAAEEFATLLKGGVPSVPEIEAAKERLSQNMSPAQLHGAIGTMAAQIQSRIQALHNQAVQAMGPAAGKVEIITPEGQSALDKLRNRGLIPKFDEGEANDRSGAPVSSASASNSSRPTAVNPKTGHTIVWNGSAWVDQ